MKKSKNNITQLTAVGVFPKDWKVVSLSEIFEFKNGINAGKESYGRGIKFVNVLEVITHNYLTKEKIPGSVDVSEKQRREFSVERGDVLFNRTSETADEVGLTAVYLDDEPIVFGGFVIRAKPKNKMLTNEFKKFCFSAPYIRKQVISFGKGAIRSNIGQGELENVLIAVPNEKEQKLISKMLTSWDDAITYTKALIETKEHRKRAIMKSLLSGKIRFKQFKNRKHITIKLGQVCRIKSGGTPLTSVKEYYNGNIPWVVIADITKCEKYLSKTEKSISKKGLENSSAKLFPKGTILFAMYASIGKCAIAGVDLTTNQAILGIEPNSQLYNEFLYYCLLNNEGKYERMGQHGAQKNLNAEMVKNFSLLLPAKEEQKKIVDILSSCDIEIFKLKQALDSLKQQKKGMLENLLTGKIRVKI
jgi:type I restriction enzyme S subunit